MEGGENPYRGKMVKYPFWNCPETAIFNIYVVGKGQERAVKNVQIPIEGMTCPGCVATVQKVVGALPGVERADISLNKKRGTFSYNESTVDAVEIVNAIEAAGYITGKVRGEEDPVGDVGGDGNMTEPVRARADRPDAGRSERIRLRITGMSCAACATNIEKAVTALPGVSSVVVNVAASAASVHFDPDRVDAARIVQGVRQAGYQASFGGDEAADGGQRERFWILWTAALALPIIMVQQNLAHPPNAEIVIALLASVLQWTSGWRFYRGAWYSLRGGTSNMDVLVALGITAAWAYSMLVFLFPDTFGSSRTFFETSAMLILFIRLGKMLEASAKGKADEALRTLIRLKPDSAIRIESGGDEREVSIGEVVLGDHLRLRPGDRVPVDGRVIEGTSAVDESSVTGESIPVVRKPGDPVTGGTMVVDGTLLVSATAIGEQTFVARMVRMVEEAQLDKAPIQRFADRVSHYFVPAVVSLAAITFVIWQWLLGSAFEFALARAVSVLVVACPCALGLATPTAILVGTGIGLRRGILFKRGSVLEGVARVDTVLFDKTGTITMGEPTLTGNAFSREMDEKDLLALAASAASMSSHPLSRAIVKAAKEKGAEVHPVNESREVPGKGVRFRLDGRQFVLGSRELVGELSDDLSGFAEQAEEWEREGRIVVWLAAEGAPLSIFAFRDEPREGVTDAIARIEEIGIRTAMVTGDRESTARGIAAYVGLGSVYAEVLPSQKAELVQEVRDKGGVVAMVGDGVNDAPALARADVGIAFGVGTDVAKETGDVILIRNDPSDVASAIELGRATVAKIRQNLFWALIYNLLAIPLAAGLFSRWGLLMSPEVAGAAMALSSISVVLNSIDLKRWRPVAA